MDGIVDNFFQLSQLTFSGCWYAYSSERYDFVICEYEPPNCFWKNDKVIFQATHPKTSRNRAWSLSLHFSHHPLIYGAFHITNNTFTPIWVFPNEQSSKPLLVDDFRLYYPIEGKKHHSSYRNPTKKTTSHGMYPLVV